MNGNAAYTVFFVCGIFWVAIATAGVIALLKSENQTLQFGRWGLLVALTTIIPLVAGLMIAAVMSQTNFSFLR